MTAIGFAKAALPALAFVLAALAAPAQGAPRLGDEDFEVFAQEADGDEADPATRRVEERRRANDGDWFRAPANQGPEDFPSAEIHDAIVANTRAATARAVYRRAESALHAGVRGAVREFEQSRELREALAAEDRAYEALQDARREALRDVVDQPKYQAMQDLRETLTRRIADRREGASPAPVAAATAGARLVSTAEVRPRAGNDVVAMASLKLRVGTDARELEREALADNDKVRRAREDLVEASRKVAELRADFDKSLRANEDLRQARAELEDARIARVTAETYLKGADLAAGRALDFAYYLHRYDYYRYRPYYDYGYGYGGSRFGYPYYGVSYIGRARR